MDTQNESKKIHPDREKEWMWVLADACAFNPSKAGWLHEKITVTAAESGAIYITASPEVAIHIPGLIRAAKKLDIRLVVAPTVRELETA